MPSGTDVVSHTKIGSQSPRFSGFQVGFSLAPVEHVVLQPIVVAVLRLPDERLQPLLIDPAAERRRRRSGGPRRGGGDWVGARPSEVFSSKPAISSSPVENGRWNTVPAGCTVIEATSGRRLRGR